MAQTEKALAKARAERESAKKAKTGFLVEVNSLGVGSGVWETDISLNSSNFPPGGSPGYAPRSPSPARAATEKVVEDAPVPFTELSKAYKNKRLNEAMKIMCVEIDREHINKTLGKNETNELCRSWLDVSPFFECTFFFISLFSAFVLCFSLY